MSPQTGHAPPLVEDLDMDLLKALTTDPTPLSLSDIHRELGCTRQRPHHLWRATCNYLYGSASEWPPSGDVLAKRLYQDQDTTACDVWWPPHVSLLPPPDFPGERPRWRAGTLRRWAMQVGRMRLDGTPAPVMSRGRTTQSKVHVGPNPALVDLDVLRRLVDDDNLWTIQDIQEFFAVSEATAGHWYRATRNRVSRGVVDWPPVGEDGRRIATGDGPGLTWWPPSPNLLPPPTTLDQEGAPRFYGEGEHRWWGEIRYLWRAGEVKRWGLATGRIGLDGVVVRRADETGGSG